MRILVAINGTSKLGDILRFCRQFIKGAKKPPTFLKVIDPRTCREPLLGYPLNILRETEEFQIGVRKSLGIRNYQLTLRVGNLEEEISREIHEKDYDLVILEDPDYRKYPFNFKKSSAQRIVEGALCPVLVLRGEISPVRSILLYEHNISGKHYLNRSAADILEILEGVADTPPQVKGSPATDEFISEARKGDYDLIVFAPDHLNRGSALRELSNRIFLIVDRPFLIDMDLPRSGSRQTWQTQRRCVYGAKVGSLERIYRIIQKKQPMHLVPLLFGRSRSIWKK